MRWYAYNGDADGICSMVQWGLVHGIEGQRITGVKRDIELLERVNPNPDDEIIVMDISLARNHARAVELSNQGFDITWFDHHLAGDPIDAISTHIDTSAVTCTARIVENFLGVESDWAQVALHGDGLSVHSSKPEFKELGELLNYNGYGADLSDLHFHPDELLLICLQAETPQNFMETQAFIKLKNGFESDLSHAQNISVTDGYYLLPNESWARRVVGVMAHRINEVVKALTLLLSTKGRPCKCRLEARKE